MVALKMGFALSDDSIGEQRHTPPALKWWPPPPELTSLGKTLLVVALHWFSIERGWSLCLNLQQSLSNFEAKMDLREKGKGIQNEGFMVWVTCV